MVPFLKWFLRKATFVLIIFLGALGLFLIAFASICTFGKPEAGSLPDDGPVAEANVRNRPLEDAYYSYPEWYIVWSYDERASYLEKARMPSDFPYFRSIYQYWHGYCMICEITHSRHQFSMGGHVMEVVLGTSFALEYAIRGAYEKSIGAFSEWTASDKLVEEDAYAARVARDYTDFVYTRPFYEFHFAHAFAGLWGETSFWGPHAFRKFERKAILSVDYGLESIYSEIIEKLSHLTYGVEPTETYASVENAPETIFQKYPHIRQVRDLGGGSYVVSIPRYQEFTTLAVQLAKDGVRFVQIAGNNEVVVSAVSENWNYETPEMRRLFFEKILTHPGAKRIVLECRVRDLHAVLNDLANRATIEHVYDY
jgi:hypothetical protein